MRRLCLFGDEAGDLTFAPSRPGITRYFFVVTVAFRDHAAVQGDLQELRHDMAVAGYDMRKGFHASEDRQHVRDRVFGTLSHHDFAVDATIFEKRKAIPSRYSTVGDHVASPVDFYRSAWFWHLQRVIPDRCLPAPEILIAAGDIDLGARRLRYLEALQTVMPRVAPDARYAAVLWPTTTDLCIQAADYCAWAIMRKWESGDTRSYALIADRVGREHDMFALGTRTYF